MEARLLRALAAASALLFLGASYRSANFVVTAPTPRFAEQVGKEAERFRRELAVLWLGQALPNWAQPCPITLQVGPQLGAGGATSFVFDRGEVFNWQMSIQGSEERILDSVLPHEVTHTIFASYFRQPLPRWADEGACTTVEHESERAKQRQMLISFLKEDRGIAFSRMFAMKEYPQDVLPLYAQGYSLCRFLIDQKDRRTFIRFLSEGMETNAWGKSLDHHYGFQDLAQLQSTWLDWVRAGSPLHRRTPEQGSDVILASNAAPAMPPVAVLEPVDESRTTALTSPPNSRDQGLAANVTPAGPVVPIRRRDSAPAQNAFDARELAATSDLPQPPAPPADLIAQPQQLTRPQPAQQARQQVLEWNQGASAANAPLPPAANSNASSNVASAPAATSPTRSMGAGSMPQIKLNPSAAQRYLPAAMARPARQQPAANRTLDAAQVAIPVTAGES